MVLLHLCHMLVCFSSRVEFPIFNSKIFSRYKPEASINSSPEASAGRKMYPKVKVRGDTEDEEDQYAFEKSSLQSLKGFEWLSLDDSTSPDESPQSIVRIPGSNFSKSTVYGFQTPKDKKERVLKENRRNVRAFSVPPSRAVLSSPDNDGIDRSKTKARRELLSGLKNYNLCQNRHTECKVIPRYAASFTSSLVDCKEVLDGRKDPQANGRAIPADSSAGPRRRKTMTPVQDKALDKLT